MTREEVKVSIIMPCFNGETFVSDIIGDIKRQTYENWELIVVGNGPYQEKQREIVRQFVESDSRISYHSLNLPGVSRARNFGISKANGDWLAFVDVDDRVPQNWLQNCLTHADNNIDMVVGGICSKNMRTFQVIRSDIHLPCPEVKSMDETVYLPLFLSNLASVYSPCSKLYNARFLRDSNINFREDFSMCEDCIFALELALKCKSMCLIPQTGYEYCQREGGSAIRSYHVCFEEAAELRRNLMRSVLERSGLEPNVVESRMANLFASDSLDVLLNEFRGTGGFSRKVQVSRRLFADKRLFKAWKISQPKLTNLPLLAFRVFHAIHAPLLSVVILGALFGLKRMLRRY